MDTRTVGGGERNEGKRLPSRWALLSALALALGALLALGAAPAVAAPLRGHPHKSHTSATPTPTKTPLALKITCGSAWNSVSAVVCVNTEPGATLTIRVTYCGQQATNPELRGQQVADKSGNFVWSWTPNTTCATAKAYVTAHSAGRTAHASTTFPITKLPTV
jgi:hypothetical protein